MSGHSNIFWTGVIAIALGVSATGCKGKKEMPKGGKPTSISAEGYVVNPGSFSDVYAASGTLLPNEEVQLLSEMSGRVTGIYFKEGAAVKQGQLLVQLYDEDLKASIKKLKAQRQLQTKTEDRQKSLLEIGGISQQDYETTQTQVQSIDADIAFAEAQLRATKIIAPFSGTIGIRNISIGAVVSPTTVIATLQQTHQLKLDFNLPEQYRSAVAPGKKVSFSVTGTNDTIEGQISAIDPGADAVTRTVRIRAIVPNNSGNLLSGAFAHVIVPIDSDPDAILVPSQSVIPTTKDKLVAVVRNGKAEMTVVKLGARTAGKVEILNGLQQGDTILTTGLMQVKQGMDVKITKLQD